MSVMSSNSQHNRIFLPRVDMLGGGYSLLFNTSVETFGVIENLIKISKLKEKL